MSELHLHVLSLRYSSWSIRPWLALRLANADFTFATSELPDMGAPLASVEAASQQLSERRQLGSVTGLFPVLETQGTRIHESLAICEFVAEQFPDAGLWPEGSLARARARSVSCEMASGFSHLRSKMGCHVFARVPDFVPDAATEVEINRVFELWSACLDASGGPFLFGAAAGIADCMYFPVVTRFRTYGVSLPEALERYAQAMESHPAALDWREAAHASPRIQNYDAGILALGGTLGESTG